MGEEDGSKKRVDSIIRTNLCNNIVNSVGQGNFTFVMKKVREFRKPLAVATMHVLTRLIW